MGAQAVREKQYDQSVVDACLACAVAEGDIVNFRFLFMPASPLRPDSPEDVHTPKYAYLFPVDESSRQYGEALRLVQRMDMARYVQKQLEKKGPPQLPWELVIALADNAVRLGKYTSAAQAYELLRIRRRMQEVILEKSDEYLRRGNVRGAVQGYLVAAGLDYDYAAFPEPLPAVPNYQERALALHGVYPDTQEKMVCMQPDEALAKTAINYLLFNPEFSNRQTDMPEENKIAFVVALIREMDKNWDVFAERHRQAAAIVNRYQPHFERMKKYSTEALELLYEEPLDAVQQDELRGIPALLTGVAVENWDWWQYMKTLCYHHPGAALFVARQRITAKEEVVIPRFRPDSALARGLNLVADG